MLTVGNLPADTSLLFHEVQIKLNALLAFTRPDFAKLSDDELKTFITAMLHRMTEEQL